MADEDREPRRPVELVQALREKPYRYGFFQAMRVLDCYYRDRPRTGHSLRPHDDPVRLAQEPSLAFAPAALSAVEDDGGNRPRLVERFFGLLGPNGPLPLHLTEFACERMRYHDDRTFSRFLDTFHHRLATLFYRAWAAAQPTVHYDRPETDRFQVYVGSLIGMGMQSLCNRDPMPDLAKRYFAGWLATRSRSADGLAAILQAFFHLPVAIDQFVGHWIRLPVDCRCRLGGSPDTGSLGVSAIIGERIWDCQQKFLVVIGPIGLADYERLLPGGASLPRLVAIVRNYIGDELRWGVNLVLKKDDVPPLQLGGNSRLGWTTWLASHRPATDAHDLILDPLPDAS